MNHYIIASTVCQSNSFYKKRLCMSNYLIELCQGELTRNNTEKGQYMEQKHFHDSWVLVY